MNERVKYPIVIAVICLIAAAALAFTYALTRERIKVAKKGDLVAGLAKVLPDAKMPPEERQLSDGATLYVGHAKNDDKIVGYATIGSAQGYSSRIKVLVGVDPQMTVVAISILEQNETPGLGERTKEVPATKSIWQAIGDLFGGEGEAEPPREPPFQSQFRGKRLDQLVLVKDQGATDKISQLTGATITSRAVVDAVKDAIGKIERAVGAGASGADSQCADETMNEE